MVTMSQYTARGIAGWEFPPVISYGAFKAATGETIYLNCPVMLDGTRDADDGHKYGVKAYGYNAIPFLIVFDKDGKEFDHLLGAHAGKLTEMVEKVLQ